MLSRPDLGVPPHLGYTASTLDRAADRRRDRYRRRRARGRPARAHPSLGGETRRVAQVRGDHRAPVSKSGRRRPGLHLRRGGGARAVAGAKCFSACRTARRGLRRASTRRPPRRSRPATTFSSPTCGRSRPAGWSRRSICRRWRRPRRCSAGTRATASAPIAGRRASAVDAGWRRDCPACGMQHFPRTDPVVDHAGDRRRALPARPQPALCAEHVVVPRRLRRARRDHGGGGAPRDPRGGRDRVRTGRLFRVAAVAVPDVADDRLLCGGGDSPRSRSIAASSRMPAGFLATRSSRCCCAGTPTA